nr:hypothetical protein [Tanacetum cinerariifolium]
MTEDDKLKIDSMMVMISVSVRCRLKTLYIRRSFRILWQKPNLQKGHFQNQCSKLVASSDKVVNMAVGDSNDALVYCVKNMAEDHIMDSSASIGMNMLASKENVLDAWKVDIYFCKPGGLGKQKKLSFIMTEKTRKLHSKSCGRYCNTPKNVSQQKYVSGALLHNTPAQDIGERPLDVV